MASDDGAPVDRFCDLVLKGGIASGVVYPLAIVELASRYRFRSIGGTSAGAVAAAVTAAAEYRRRTANSMDGFEVVKRIATDLQQPVGDGATRPEGPDARRAIRVLRRAPGRRSSAAPASVMLRLQCLFAPDPGCERLFHVLVRTMSRAHRTGHAARQVRGERKAGEAGQEEASQPDASPAEGGPSAYVESVPWALARALLVAYRPMVMAGALAGLALGILCGWRIGAGYQAPALAWLAGSMAGVGIALLAAAVLAVGGTAWWLRSDIVRKLVPNDLGLCRGAGVSPEGIARITPWLNELIQSAAGLAVAGDPLTFGQLWYAPGFPPSSMPDIPVDGERRSIDLVMFTTNVTHGRPYTFPHHDERARLFYQPDVLASFLPPSVMDWMKRHPGNYEPEPGKEPSHAAMKALGLVPIPEAEDFPVVLAARMSLSYPLLFSAVPLWAIDYEQPNAKRCFRRCWFSDGGIASNFPMHLFDGFLPAWPTFGIDLEGIVPGSAQYVYLPTEPDRGIADRWNRFDEDEADSTRFAGFLMAVISTMQNWNDNTNARMPGVRDRIARVRLREQEGGFNLDMPADCQREVADRGRAAAALIIARFAGDAGPTQGWDEQRWARLEVLARTLEKRMPGVELALRDGLPGTTPYARLVTSDRMRVSGSDAALTAEQQKMLATLLSLIGDAARQLGRAAGALNTRPTPDPELRVRAPL